MKKLGIVSVVITTLACSLICALAAPEGSDCKPVGPYPATGDCAGHLTSCSGSCARQNTDCSACVGPSSGTCSPPAEPINCNVWQETGNCNGIPPFCGCLSWTVVPGSSQQVRNGC